MHIGLVVIDGQVDFCEGGAFPVPGAYQDMECIAGFIRNNIDRLDIQLSIDGHYPFNIAHPLAWVDVNGNEPQAHTVITSEQVCSSTPTWIASNKDFMAPGYGHRTFDEVQREYIATREVFCGPLVIRPYHCILGTPGQCLQADLSDAVMDWEKERKAIAVRHQKGAGFFNEQLSVVAAEVPTDADPFSDTNHLFLDTLETYDKILWAGEALDYCVKASITDVLDEFSDDIAKKMVILEDCTSAVNAPGAEKIASDFLDVITKKGAAVTTSDKVFDTTI